MKKLLVIFFLTFLFSANIFSQGTAGIEAKFEYRNLIDMPTAGILEKGFVGVTSDVLPNGVLIARIEAGVFENVSIGISYGGSNIIGSGSPDWYKIPAASIRFRMFNEELLFPAITVGFDMQGKGDYFSGTERYAIKSPGFFAAGSKNFEFLGFLSLHGTLNYSLESKDGDNFLNLRVGGEKTIGNKVSVVAEYDFAFNDNTTDNFGSGNGYLNIGVRWSIADGFTLGFDLRDMLNNKKWSPGSADRALKIEYIKPIF